MIRRTWPFAAAAAGALALSPAAAQAASAPVSSIYSATQNSCLDLSTTHGPFLDTYGHACDQHASQQFTFTAVSSAAGTYEIAGRSSGLCLFKFRYGIRQESCAAAPTWTLKPTDSTGTHFQMATLGVDCVQVAPAPPGYPGPLFDLAACNASNPAQILTIGLGA